LIAVGADNVVKFKAGESRAGRCAEIAENFVGDGVNQAFEVVRV
jgi:hypothetical protein